jgi:hypothetical protein
VATTSDQPLSLAPGAAPEAARDGASAPAEAQAAHTRPDVRTGFPATRMGALAMAATAVLALPLASLVTAPAFLQDRESYLSVHTILELFAVAVSALIAGVGWNAIHGSRSGHMTVVATGFLAVAVLDLMHLLSFSGMPVFITPSGPEKAILFWLAARFAGALTLLVVVLAPNKWTAGPSLRAGALSGACLYAALVAWLVLDHRTGCRAPSWTARA